MGFTTPAFIRKNTPELRKKLEYLGYSHGKPEYYADDDDNRMIYVPNGSLSGNAVTNYSKQDKRRVEWVFGVEYGEDVKRVRAVLQRIINADSRILDTPAPLIVLGSLSASSVDITVRVWVKSVDYWNVLYDINEIVYTTFNEEGIGFPFPQLTLHHAKD